MNLLVALFSIASLIWLVPVIQRGRLLAIAMLVLGVGTVFGPYFFAIDGPFQFSLDRGLWLAMFTIAFAGLRFGQVRLPALTRVDWAVIAIVGWFLISALGGGPPLPNSSPPVAKWIFYVAMPAGMYLIARIVPVRAHDIHWMISGLVTLGLYLAITAMLEVFGPHGLVFPQYIVDPDPWQFFGRGRGPLMNPTANGFIISIALTACLLAAIESGRQGKLLYGLALVVLFGGLYATLTRSVWLGGIGGLAVVGCVYSPRWVRVLGLAVAVLLAGALAMGVKDQLVRMKRDKQLSAADAKKSVELRPLLAVVAWEMFKDRPIIGHGLGRYEQRKDPFHTNRSYGLPLEQARDYVQHNVLLAVLVETGLIGFALMLAWLTMIAGLGWSLARNARAQPEARSAGLLLLGMMATYVCNGMFHDILIIPMTQMFFLFIAGIAVSIHQSGLISSKQRAGAAPAASGRGAAFPAV